MCHRALLFLLLLFHGDGFVYVNSSQPIGHDLIDPFTGIAYQIPCISDIYITIHNSRKLQLWSSSKLILWLGSAQDEELSRVEALGRLKGLCVWVHIHIMCEWKSEDNLQSCSLYQDNNCDWIWVFRCGVRCLHQLSYLWISAGHYWYPSLILALER